MRPRLAWGITLVFAVGCAGLACLPEVSAQSATANRDQAAPEVLVEKLYSQVVARQPLGLLYGGNWKVFVPYLSKALLLRIDSARSCEEEWILKDQKNQILQKAPMAWSEAGLFSGANDLADPSSFQLERAEPNRGGSSTVYVKLTESAANEKPWSWQVAVKVVTEDKRPFVDDVIYLKGKDVDTEYRLSEVLAIGCNAGHWVGDGKQ